MCTCGICKKCQLPYINSSRVIYDGPVYEDLGIYKGLSLNTVIKKLYENLNLGSGSSFSLEAGDGIEIDNTNPLNLILSAMPTDMTLTNALLQTIVDHLNNAQREADDPQALPFLNFTVNPSEISSIQTITIPGYTTDNYVINQMVTINNGSVQQVEYYDPIEEDYVSQPNPWTAGIPCCDTVGGEEPTPPVEPPASFMKALSWTPALATEGFTTYPEEYWTDSVVGTLDTTDPLVHGGDKGFLMFIHSMGENPPAPNPVPTDSETNSWTLIGSFSELNSNLSVFFSKNPTTNVEHDFEATADEGFIFSTHLIMIDMNMFSVSNADGIICTEHSAGGTSSITSCDINPGTKGLVFSFYMGDGVNSVVDSGLAIVSAVVADAMYRYESKVAMKWIDSGEIVEPTWTSEEVYNEFNVINFHLRWNQLT